MTYSLHPEAAKELEDAFTFYREQGGIGLAHAFLAEFERVASLLVSNPDFGTPSRGGRRSFPLRRFPYSLIYRAYDRCLHPGCWTSAPSTGLRAGANIGTQQRAF